MTNAHTLLSAEDEIALAKSIEAGVLAAQRLADSAAADADDARADVEALAEVERAGRQAWQEFLLANVRLVQAVINTEARERDGGDELFQEGFLGLAEALRRWDHAKGYRFSTYAVQWIRRFVVNAMAQRALPASPRTVLRARQVRAVVDQLTAHLSRVPTDDEVAASIGRNPAWVAHMRGLQPHLPLVPDLIVPCVDEPVDDNADVAAMVGRLPWLEASVVRLRFGLDGETGLSQVACARRLDLSLSTLRRYESRALRRLRCWAVDELAA